MRIAILARALACAAFLIAHAARADLYSATQAYQKHDYARAFHDFKELAELGQPTAQYDLAAMYAHGEGVEMSFTLAHAWASLAARNGEPHAQALVDELTPRLTANSLKLSADIQSQYGADALGKRLFPSILAGREYEHRDPVRRDKIVPPDYPYEARRRGVGGEVFVEFTVMPDGHARLPRILHALPAGYFERVVRESVLRSSFLPGRLEGRPVATVISTFYNFKLTGVSIADYGGLELRTEETLRKAEAGDTRSQLLYAMMIAGLPQLNKPYSEALPWFLRAAQAGSPYAQYQLGTNLMQGRGCRCDNAKGQVWLEKAAQSDEPDAQVSLAEYLLAEHTDESLAAAKLWLERAAQQNHAMAKLMLAAILATASPEQARDPARSLALTAEVEREFEVDPTFWEIRAAAAAAKGDFDLSVNAQNQAISRATRLGWDLSALKERLALYRARRAFVGNLLDFAEPESPAAPPVPTAPDARATAAL